jgi:hypothetical protein
MRAEPFQRGRIGYLVAALAIAVAIAVLKLLGSQLSIGLIKINARV